MSATQMTLTTTPATLLTAIDNKGQTHNFAIAEGLGGAVVCHRSAHRHSEHDSRPSESDQWVAYFNGKFQGVWYHADLFQTFLRIRGWEIGRD